MEEEREMLRKNERMRHDKEKEMRQRNLSMSHECLVDLDHLKPEKIT